MQWKDRSPITIELALFFLCCIALGFLFLILVATMARAESCLIIDVPPSAVVGQPDGDTFYLFNFAPGGRVKIRVADVDTPEHGEPGFEEATAFTRDWLAEGVFRVTTCGKPTFDRIVAEVKRNGKTLAQALDEAGHAR